MIVDDDDDDDDCGDDCCLILTFKGELVEGSVLIDVFCGFLFIGFFKIVCELFVTDLGFDGEGLDSFFLILAIVDVIDDLISLVDWDLTNFVVTRGLDNDESKEIILQKKNFIENFLFTFRIFFNIYRLI